MTNIEKNRYEMFWDCSSCGTKKLLGITHRYCPNCGKPQDENKRYFPANGEGVALYNHPYYGIDWDCQYCSKPNSNNSKNCVSCGGPKDGSYQVGLVDNNNKIVGAQTYKISTQENIKTNYSEKNETNLNSNKDLNYDLSSVKKINNSFEKPLTEKQSFLFGLLFCCFLFLLGFVVWGVSYSKIENIEVYNKSWSRSIQVEEFKKISDDDWCSNMPFEAYNVTRKRVIRDYKDVPTHKICTMKNKDLGDGSYTSVESCTQQYKREPIYDNKCYYNINRWRNMQSFSSSGNFNEPYWADLSNLKFSEEKVLGNKRKGSQDSSYQVTFSYYDKQVLKIFNCSFSQNKWNNFNKGQKFKIEMNFFSTPKCNTLSK